MANEVDQTVPQNSESPTLGAQRIRETREGFNDILTVEHDISDSATTKGFHGTNVTGKVDTAISTPPSGYGRFGWKTITGVAELFYRDDAGNEKQITNAGKLNVVDADGAVVKTGAQAIAGVKTFSDSPIVPDLSADDNSTKVANTKYVDAQVAANAGWTEVTSPTVKTQTLNSTSYVNIDLSADVGAQKVLVKIKMKSNNGGIIGIFRANGSSHNFTLNSGASTNACQVTATDEEATCIVETDSNGIIEGKVNGTVSVSITPMSFTKLI
jgi:hypothetical protein